MSLSLTSPVIAIHGGAGTLSRASISVEQQARYRAALDEILRSAQAMLADGAAAIDVVTEAVRQLEECPLFNAGRGSVYTADGLHELDACVMRGSDLAAGAVAGVRTLRNPILAARAVMEAGGPVLLIGPGAEQFAAERGCETVAPEWFDTPHRLAQLHAMQASDRIALDHDGASQLAPTVPAPLDERDKFGTVGAVALDAHGHLAAATSTGGMTNKRFGRLGDVPVIGAGTYANNRTAAISATGWGERFIRHTVAHDISALMEYKGLTLQQAADEVIHRKLEKDDGGKHAFHVHFLLGQRDQRPAAASSLSRASTHRAPCGVSSRFQKGARVLR